MVEEGHLQDEDEEEDASRSSSKKRTRTGAAKYSAKFSSDWGTDWPFIKPGTTQHHFGVTSAGVSWSAAIEGEQMCRGKSPVTVT